MKRSKILALIFLILFFEASGNIVLRTHSSDCTYEFARYYAESNLPPTSAFTAIGAKGYFGLCADSLAFKISDGVTTMMNTGIPYDPSGSISFSSYPITQIEDITYYGGGCTGVSFFVGSTKVANAGWGSSGQQIDITGNLVGVYKWGDRSTICYGFISTAVCTPSTTPTYCLDCTNYETGCGEGAMQSSCQLPASNLCYQCLGNYHCTFDPTKPYCNFEHQCVGCSLVPCNSGYCNQETGVCEECLVNSECSSGSICNAGSCFTPTENITYSVIYKIVFWIMIASLITGSTFVGPYFSFGYLSMMKSLALLNIEYDSNTLAEFAQMGAHLFPLNFEVPFIGEQMLEQPSGVWGSLGIYDLFLSNTWGYLAIIFLVGSGIYGVSLIKDSRFIGKGLKGFFEEFLDRAKWNGFILLILCMSPDFYQFSLIEMKFISQFTQPAIALPSFYLNIGGWILTLSFIFETLPYQIQVYAGKVETSKGSKFKNLFNNIKTDKGMIVLVFFLRIIANNFALIFGSAKVQVAFLLTQSLVMIILMNFLKPIEKVFDKLKVFVFESLLIIGYGYGLNMDINNSISSYNFFLVYINIFLAALALFTLRNILSMVSHKKQLLVHPSLANEASSQIEPTELSILKLNKEIESELNSKQIAGHLEPSKISPDLASNKINECNPKNPSNLAPQPGNYLLQHDRGDSNLYSHSSNYLTYNSIAPNFVQAQPILNNRQYYSNFQNYPQRWINPGISSRSTNPINSGISSRSANANYFGQYPFNNGVSPFILRELEQEPMDENDTIEIEDHGIEAHPKSSKNQVTKNSIEDFQSFLRNKLSK